MEGEAFNKEVFSLRMIDHQAWAGCLVVMSIVVMTGVVVIVVVQLWNVMRVLLSLGH